MQWAKDNIFGNARLLKSSSPKCISHNISRFLLILPSQILDHQQILFRLWVLDCLLKWRKTHNFFFLKDSEFSIVSRKIRITDGLDRCTFIISGIFTFFFTILSLVSCNFTIQVLSGTSRLLFFLKVRP